MKTKVFARIFSFILIICFAFLCVGCMGRDPDDYIDDEDINEGLGDLALEMYGAKVLYKPDSYDFNAGSGAEAGTTNDYYGKYAYHILNNLLLTYGTPNNSTLSYALPEFATGGAKNANIPYLYDSIRYKVDTIGTVNVLKEVDAEGNETVSDIASADQQFIIGANINHSWNWTFDYDLSAVDNTMNALIFDGNSYVSGSRLYNVYDSLDEFKSEIDIKYTTNSSFQNDYADIYLGTTNVAEEANYSEYVKALQYAIYCIALDIQPQQITPVINENVTTSNPSYFTLQVGSYTATANKSSVDLALEDIKSLFQKLGSYVGLMNKQLTKIADWVKTNVIGWQVKVLNDNFFRYSSVTKVVTTDTGGNSTISYEFDMSNMSANPLGRNYISAVDAIVLKVCSDVSIGKEGDGALTIDNRFLASEVKEYAGDTFIISGDANFPAPENTQSAISIQPLEYQSVTIMLKEETEIDEIWVALKYDADLDGTVDGVWDENRYIDMIVELNYFSHAKGKLFNIASQSTRVYDGPYELSGNFPDSFPDDHGTLFFEEFDKSCSDSELLSIMNNGAIKIGAFNPDIGSGILKTDVGVSGYNGKPLVSQNPLVLVGTTNVRKYYKIVEPVDDELASHQTYLTGRMNEDMFKGSDGCDYLEITYKVLKNKGDHQTNYKFYTGIAAVFDSGAL
ncbi:MAG: hypothetical protein J6C53_00525 [Clostridia bacterium]|nr:hypothetical protein [Clostridia bacterium]